MDPYLEAPDIWPDLHDSLAGQIRAALNHSLPAPYYARLEMRMEVGIIEEDRSKKRIVPDVAVVRHPGADSGVVAVLDAPRTAISKFHVLSIPSEPIRHLFVEIRDPSRGHQLITLIEIASPSNKRPGEDRRAYLAKQQEVLDSDASLIELDFLRDGERMFTHVMVKDFVARLDPSPDYLVTINRGWRGVDGVAAYQFFPVLVTESLPCIPVPLRRGQEELPLDLQFVMNRAYDDGPYRRGAVDYSQPPRPPLPADFAAWAKKCLSQAAEKLKPAAS
jgi:hypothetical protein